MKLSQFQDAPVTMIDPDNELEPWPMPGVDGDEYGYAVGTEVVGRNRTDISPVAMQRMDNEVLRNLAVFAAANPNLDLSNVQLVEGPLMPMEPQEARVTICSYRSTSEERAAAWESVTKFSYTRGWYAIAKERVGSV